jgi:hypothetical protein
MSDDGTTAAWERINTKVPHSARLWDYLLGGKDHFAVDREAGEQMVERFPDYAKVARLQRRFLVRAVTYLVREAGIRQFLDIGTGLPTAGNTHEVAQSIDPRSRVVYVDNDPIVLVHARALLTSAPEGATSYLDADVRDPEKILREAERTLAFDEPVAVMMLGIAGQVTDADDPKGLIDTLMAPLAPGSHLALTDGTDTHPPLVEALNLYNETARNTYQLRSPERLAGFFAGLEPVEPGVVPTQRWRPEPAPSAEGATDVVASMAGVARKP